MGANIFDTVENMPDRRAELHKVGRASTSIDWSCLGTGIGWGVGDAKWCSRVRILLLVRALGFGGAERQVVDLAHGLARCGHDVGVAAFYPGAAFDRALHGPNPELIVIGKRGRWDAVGFLWRLIRSVAAWRPDIVYSFLPVPNLAGALCCAVFCRRAALVWGLRGTPLDLDRYDWLERVSIRLERLASRLPDLVIANSQSGAAWARGAEFAARRVAMIGNGIDADRFRPPASAERVAARAAFGCKEDAFVVAVVARLDPMKDHPTFLAALAIALRTAPRLTGLIVGDGPLPVAARLRAKATALGIADALIWAAARPRVTEVYHAADLLCLPSAYGEGFPNVVGEAMACGLTCIVTSVGDSAALVGGTGRVVPPRSPAALARAILDCVEPIRESPPVNPAARQRIVENFGLDSMISATENALLQVVVGRRRRDVEGASC
jgi:glycosyltransferase involved in cell wall biosynthesis